MSIIVVSSSLDCNCDEYPIQHSLKSGGTKYHFRQVKVPGTTLIERLETKCHVIWVVS
jgi:hypothetical protein